MNKFLRSTDITTVSFTTIVAIKYFWIENIRLAGTIEKKVNRCTDVNGVDYYTKQWSIKGLEAVGLGNSKIGLAEGTNYLMISGAEMFTITDPLFSPGPNSDLSSKIFIHQGTIVLENTNTNERVIARHMIKKNSKTKEVTSIWL